MDKTVVVEVSRYNLDRVYKKYVKQLIRYKAHDEKNEYQIGDRVEIQEFRPISREKRFEVVRLISRPVLAETGVRVRDYKNFPLKKRTKIAGRSHDRRSSGDTKTSTEKQP